MKVVFVSPEVVPFAKTGGLADVSGALPAALAELGCKVSVIMPFYRLVKKNGFSPKRVKENVSFNLAGEESSFNLLYLREGSVDFYFIEKDEFYDREALYNTPEGDYEDNALRFGFFSRAVLSSIEHHIGIPDIINCNDWQSALVPLYMRFLYKDNIGFTNTKVLFSIHNMAYQGLFEKSALNQIGLGEEFFHQDRLEFWGKLNFMKSGILYSDSINTVSEGYRREILTEGFGCGLDGLLRTREDDVHGILNGADYKVWNPATDKLIFKNYTADDLSPKLECKKDLLKQFGIKFAPEKAVIGMVTRLAEQKGLDLVAQAIEDIISMGANLICLGTGDEKYNRLFRDIGKKYGNDVGIKVDFDNILAHKVEAGSDMFLMPSRYEPCGLNQMYSLKYATIPIVRATGGLDDTIEEFNPKTKEGNGFKFKDASKENLLGAIDRALKIYKDKDMWSKLQSNGLNCDFSWEASAKKYVELYKSMLAG